MLVFRDVLLQFGQAGKTIVFAENVVRPGARGFHFNFCEYGRAIDGKLVALGIGGSDADTIDRIVLRAASKLQRPPAPAAPLPTELQALPL